MFKNKNIRPITISEAQQVTVHQGIIKKFVVLSRPNIEHLSAEDIKSLKHDMSCKIHYKNTNGAS